MSWVVGTLVVSGRNLYSGLLSTRFSQPNKDWEVTIIKELGKSIPGLRLQTSWKSIEESGIIGKLVGSWWLLPLRESLRRHITTIIETLGKFLLITLPRNSRKLRFLSDFIDLPFFKKIYVLDSLNPDSFKIQVNSREKDGGNRTDNTFV